MTDSIELRITPPDLVPRMRRYPEKLQSEMERTMKQSLAHLQGSVPEYPAADPSSSYVRTGTLGRSIGLGGRADIYQIDAIGGGYEAKFGTRLSYAPYVIDADRQARMHSGRWWTLQSVLGRAQPGIMRLFEAMTRRMVEFLGG